VRIKARGHRDLGLTVVGSCREISARMGDGEAATWVNSRGARPSKFQGLFLRGLRPDHRRRDFEKYLVLE